MPIKEELLKILVCPKCKGKLYYDKERDALICKKCKLLYRIKDGIPIMIVEKAEVLK